MINKNFRINSIVGVGISFLLMITSVQITEASSLNDMGETFKENPLSISMVENILKIKDRGLGVTIENKPTNIKDHREGKKDIGGPESYYTDSLDSDILTYSNAPTYLRSNYLKMRQSLEMLFDTKVSGYGGYGVLYNWERFGSNGAASQGTHKYESVALHSRNGKYSTLIEDNKEALANIAADTFSDIDGTEWYAYLIPTAIYYGLLEGNADGTFGGDDPVTYAELAVMLGNSMGVHRRVKISGFSVEKNPLFEKQWYSKDLGNLSCWYSNEDSLTLKTVNKNVTRGELYANVVNYWIFNSLRGASREKVGDRSYKKYFKDVKNALSQPETNAKLDKAMIETRNWYMGILANPSKGAPYDIVVGLIAASDSGCVNVNQNGNSNWYKPATKADVLDVMYHLYRLN